MDVRKHIKNLGSAFKEVFVKPGYWVLAIVFAFIIFSVNPLIRNYRLVTENPEFIITVILAAPSSTAIGPFTTMTLVAVLAGIVLAFSIFLVTRQIKSGIAAGASGIIVGLLAPSCPACAIGILSVVGLGGFLSVLPFKGQELGVIGVLILVGSMFFLSNKIATKVCKLK